jgi:uncharacterized protein YjiS (DUF1127 family)
MWLIQEETARKFPTTSQGSRPDYRNPIDGAKEMSADLAKQGLLRVGFAGVLAPWRHAARDVLRWLRLWGERERQRRELSMLSDRDFAGLGVPKMLAIAETRKWPWQKWHPQWEELEAQRREVVRRLRSL